MRKNDFLMIRKLTIIVAMACMLAGCGEYSKVMLPTEWLTEDDYIHYLKWTDLYASVDTYAYLKGYDDVPVAIDDFSSFVKDYPDYYTGER